MSAVDLVDSVKNFPVIKSAMSLRDRRRFSTSDRGGLFWGVYPSFEAALAAAPATKPTSYDHPDAAELYRDMVGSVATRDYPLLFWLGQILQSTTAILDFGGHFGLKYYTFKPLLKLSKQHTWTVYDLPAVTAAGRRYAAARQDTGITFVDSTLGLTDELFFAAGSLQYLAHSVSTELRRLRSLPRHVLIGSLPVHNRRFFTLQNIGASICPYQIFGAQDFKENMAQMGYELVDTWVELEKSCFIPQHPKHSLKHYEGFYFRQDAV